MPSVLANKVVDFALFVMKLNNGVTLKKYMGPVLELVLKVAHDDGDAMNQLVSVDEYYFLRSLNIIRSKFGNVDYFVFVLGIFTAYAPKIHARWIGENIYKQSLKEHGIMTIFKQFFDTNWHEFEYKRARLNKLNNKNE